MGLYERSRGLITRVLRVPPPPEPPSGAPGTLLVFHPAPGFLTYRRFGWVVAQLLACAGFYWEENAHILDQVFRAFERLSPWFWNLYLPAKALIVLSLASQAILTLIVLKLDVENRFYLVTDRALRIREGVLTIRELTMTFANLQNVTINQGPIQRLLGISDLKVKSAGGVDIDMGSHGHDAGLGLHTGFFRGLDNAEEIRSIMMERLRRIQDSGLGDPDDRSAPAPAAADPSAAPPITPDLDAVLASLRDEARALRASAERLGPAPHA